MIKTHIQSWTIYDVISFFGDCDRLFKENQALNLNIAWINIISFGYTIVFTLLYENYYLCDSLVDFKG